MIFAGDVAIAHGDRMHFNGFPERIRRVPWCINLEGPVLPPARSVAWGTYNTAGWIDTFDGFDLSLLFAANNHIQDVPDGIALSEEFSRNAKLCLFGAGVNSAAAAIPAAAYGQGGKYVVLGFGWSVIGCTPASAWQPGVNSLEAQDVRRQVGTALRDAGDARVVVVIHGNYEFERYPQPALRMLAFELLDLGVYAVICHHPHIVGPIERYDGRAIAYSLGNWAFSHKRFFRGELEFPNSSFHQIAIELGESGDVVHHAMFSPPSTVRYLFDESVASEKLSLRAEFEGLSHLEYVKWFKQNRIKRKLLPIYKNPEPSITNIWRNKWVALRQTLIDAAAKAGAKKVRRRA